MRKSAAVSALLAITVLLSLVATRGTNAADFYEVSREVEYRDANGNTIGGFSTTCDSVTIHYGEQSDIAVQTYRAVCEEPIRDRAPVGTLKLTNCFGWVEVDAGNNPLNSGMCCPYPMTPAVCPN